MIITFGARSALKRDFDSGYIPLKRDITGHQLIKGYSSLDHTIPKSAGGKSELYNYSLMDMVANNTRGSKPIKEFIDIESLIEYIRVFLDLKTPNIDGIEYLKGWLRTLQRAVKEGK